jgi:hypothetical protein
MRFCRFVSFFFIFFVTCQRNTGIWGWTNQQGFFESIENVIVLSELASAH